MTFSGDSIQSNHECETSVDSQFTDNETECGEGILDRVTSEGQGRVTSEGECRIIA
jgi:hypothetical protein